MFRGLFSDIVALDVTPRRYLEPKATPIVVKAKSPVPARIKILLFSILHAPPFSCFKYNLDLASCPVALLAGYIGNTLPK